MDDYLASHLAIDLCKKKMKKRKNNNKYQVYIDDGETNSRYLLKGRLCKEKIGEG